MKKAKAVPKAQGIRYRYRQDGTLRGYEVRYRDPAGRVRGKTLPTLEEARRFQKANAQTLQQGNYIAPEKQRTPWAIVAREWLDTRRLSLRARTYDGYERILGLGDHEVALRKREPWTSRWDNKQIGQITRDDIRRLLRDLREQGKSEETEHRIFNVVSAVFKFAANEGYIQVNPVESMRGGKELRSISKKSFQARAVTAAEAQAIIDHLPDGRYRVFGLLGLWTGFRAGELAGLRCAILTPCDRRCRPTKRSKTFGAVSNQVCPRPRRAVGGGCPFPKRSWPRSSSS